MRKRETVGSQNMFYSTSEESGPPPPPKRLCFNFDMNFFKGLTITLSTVGATSAAPAMRKGREKLLIPYMMARIAGSVFQLRASPVEAV
ncbi:hypothetical protein NDN08_001478 [Rhodosorus marinus]|uniref:Uncharacterized protein n=1 Tax=Rhodosorus marinus TaxID=101924 RepID=A0AAV8UTY1_9RHOD|nr:hypothetical protein NDN08_001478 [Rhodosorus marinus]